MTWLLLHLYRRSIIAWVAGTMLIAVGVGISWQLMRSSVSIAGIQQCISAFSACSPTNLNALQQFNEVNRRIYEVLLAVPLLMGVFVGAPLMGRELENRTHRLVWTQGVTPMHWFFARTGLAVAFCVALAAVIGVAATLWLAFASSLGGGTWTQFDSYPPVFVIYVAFAVVLGVSVATVTGRTVVSMAVAGLVWLGVRGAVGIFLRPFLMRPLIRRGMTTSSAGDWYLGLTYVDKSGRQYSESQVDGILQQLGGGGPDPYKVLEQHGIFVAGLYQPASRFWTFQSLEAGLFILLTVTCVAVAIAWVQWRLARQ